MRSCPFRRWRSSLIAVALLAVISASVSTSSAFAQIVACDLFPPLSTQLTMYEAVVLVEWVDGGEINATRSLGTNFLIKRSVRSPQAFREDRRLNIYRTFPGKVGEQYLLLGNPQGPNKKLEWSRTIPVSTDAFLYLVKAPAPDIPPATRIAYFIKFLESGDPLISKDAFEECNRASFEVLEKLADQLPRDKIRDWVKNPDTHPDRIGLYSRMLGLTGTPDDAKILEDQLLVSKRELFRGLAGQMEGYLLIAKDQGLDLLDTQILSNHNSTYYETQAAIQALGFMWYYAPKAISRERWQRSILILLDRPELAESLIHTLRHWKTWTLQDHLMKMYDDPRFDKPSIKKSIISYMVASASDVFPTVAGAPPKHVIAGRKLVEQLRLKDPEMVAAVERRLAP